MRALHSAATGMSAQQKQIDVISNNLANINTTAFKKSRVAFQDLHYQKVRDAGMGSVQGNILPSGVQVGNGVRTVSIDKVFSTGSVQNTGQPLHMAIQGEGFFQVMSPTGDTLYTRDGSFTNDKDGNIVTHDGYLLEPGFTLPDDTTSVMISEDGVISVLAGGDLTPVEVGQVELARFVNPVGLDSTGGNYYAETASSGEPITVRPGDDGSGTVLQNHLESSNVDIAQELVNMIVAQRSYETASKAISTSDEMLAEANNLKR